MSKTTVADAAAKAEGFDLSAWLEQSSLPEGEAVIYGDAIAAADLQAVDRAIDSEADDRVRAQLVRQRDQLVAQVQASALTIRLRALTDEQRDQIVRDHPEPDGIEDPDELAAARRAWDRDYGNALIATMAISPRLSAKDVAAIREATNATTFASLIDRAGEVNRMVVADAPFWRRLSKGSPA